MAVKTTTKEYKRVDLVEVWGRLDSSTSPQLEKVLQRIIDARHYRIVVQLEGCDFMSPAGVRALFSAVEQVRRFNRGDLRLVLPKSAFEKAERLMSRGRLSGVPSPVKNAAAIILTGLRDAFQFFDTPEDAVGSF